MDRLLRRVEEHGELHYKLRKPSLIPLDALVLIEVV